MCPLREQCSQVTSCVNGVQSPVLVLQIQISYRIKTAVGRAENTFLEIFLLNRPLRRSSPGKLKRWYLRQHCTYRYCKSPVIKRNLRAFKGQINATNLPRHKLLFHTFEFDVAELVGYDRKRDDLFFTGSGLIGEMHLFRIQKASTDRSTGPQCITCPIKDCHYSTSLFSPPNNRILIKCESPYKTPLIYLKFTSDITKSWILLLLGPLSISKSYLDYLIRPGISSSDIPPPDQQTDSTPLPTVRFEVITLSHGLNAYVQLILPPDFDPKSKHPVIVSVYGGPNSHNVRLY